MKFRQNKIAKNLDVVSGHALQDLKKSKHFLGYDTNMVFTGDIVFEIDGIEVIKGYVETAPIKLIGDYFTDKIELQDNEDYLAVVNKF